MRSSIASASSTKKTITTAGKNSPIDNAARSAIVIESSIVMRRARTFSTASRKIGNPPASVATSAMALAENPPRHDHAHTTAAATSAIRSRSADETFPPSCSWDGAATADSATGP